MLISFRWVVWEFGAFSGQEKNIRFILARVERREALSIPGAQRSRNGRGSEHGAFLGYAPRGAAQAGLTEGAERSSKLRHETNVEWEDQPEGCTEKLAWVFVVEVGELSIARSASQQLSDARSSCLRGCRNCLGTDCRLVVRILDT